MIWAVAAALWASLAAGVYLTLSRDLLRCILGLALLGNAVNLLLLASGRINSSQPAVIAAGETLLSDAANPLPQALILTAIVIGFALICFALVLAMRLLESQGHADIADLRIVEPPASDPVKPPLDEDDETARSAS
jgi:multicomponent Na+:H+ antiporter subunit C